MKPSRTALLDAAKRWDVATVKALAKAAPDLLEARDPKGRMALHIACSTPPGGKGLGEKNGIETVTALLKAGAELDAIAFDDNDGGDWRGNALWFAVSRGENLPLVQFLVKRGADPAYSLWAAVFRNDAAMMAALLKGKPRLHLIAGAEKETPIFSAARLQRLECLELLIKAGADPRIKDGRGRTAVEIAKARRLPKDVIARLEALAAKLR